MKTLKVEIEAPLSEKLFQVLASIGFWNKNGQDIYEQNRAGKMGGAYSQSQSRRLNYEDFCLDSLLSEIETFATGSGEYWPAGYKYGKSGSHIWVSNAKNERVLFIHF